MISRVWQNDVTINLQSSNANYTQKESLTNTKDCINANGTIKIEYDREQVSQDLIGNPVEAGAVPPL